MNWRIHTYFAYMKLVSKVTFHFGVEQELIHTDLK